MFNMKAPNLNRLSTLFCLALIILTVGCAAQPAEIEATSNADLSSAEGPSPCLTSMEAMNSVGKTACVEFFIGNPSQLKGDVFLNEKADYTKGFGVTIMADSAVKFEDPLSKYRYKTIRATGQIVVYDGHPGIIVSDPSNITIVR
jgi:hypothetical protein